MVYREVQQWELAAPQFFDFSAASRLDLNCQDESDGQSLHLVTELEQMG